MGGCCEILQESGTFHSRNNPRPTKSHTNASGGGSSRGAAEKALLQVPHWPLGGSVSQASSLIPSVRGWSSILHRESMNQDRESYQEISKQWVWRPAVQEPENLNRSGYDERKYDLQPFATLNKATLSLHGKSVVKLAAPSMLNDYYTNLLDCSCNGMVALALGSSVYIWNSETRDLVGHLDLSPQSGCRYRQSVSSLCWSTDGRALSIATRRGEIQLWDVEHKQNMRFLVSHLTVVRALSWKQQLLSSGSVLGHICHLDPRAFTPLVGVATQREGVCSLQWSPGGKWLASGSTEGLLHIWDDDIMGKKMSSQPVMTVKQPSAVKAMGWCPWQRNIIATGGGWKDGELRIWDTQSASCVTSAQTNSQICSLQWAEKKRYLVTGHGLPHHKVTSWVWEFHSLSPIYQFTGHSDRVLHLALNPDNSQIFSTGADQRFHIWDL
ncbi:unnamed protein product [Oreochromis niloticus]|nr:unnamed protein product [Mustela putorius furo]